MRALILFLTGLFPFLFVNGAMAFVVPPLPALTLVLCGGYAAVRLRRERGVEPGRTAKLLYAAYFALLFFFLFFLFRFSVYHYAAVLLPALAACIALAAARKLRVELAAGLLLNITTLCVFLLFLPPRCSDKLLDRINTEKYIRPVFLFMGNTTRPDRGAFRLYDGVRRITSNSDESRLFFTAKGKGNEKNDAGFYSLRSIDPRIPGSEKPIRWSSSRIYDAELTPDEKYLLATDYDNGKLLKLDAATLEPVESRPTNPYPMFIVVDRIFNRAFVTHEGNGTMIEFSLPDLEQKHKKNVFGSPIDVAVDWNSGEMYTSNWMFPYMLSEIDLHLLKKIRVKFPLSFVGGGVALDSARRRVYVSNSMSGKVFAVDRDTFGTTGTLRAKPGARPVLVDEKRKLIYVGNMLGPDLLIFGFDHRRVGSVYVGRNCRALYLTPKTNRLLAGTALGIFEVNVDLLLYDERQRSTRRAQKPGKHGG